MFKYETSKFSKYLLYMSNDLNAGKVSGRMIARSFVTIKNHLLKVLGQVVKYLFFPSFFTNVYNIKPVNI